MTTTDLCMALQNSMPALFQCSPAPVEGVQVRTPFMYPDGDMVDVFIIERAGNFIVTDHGEGLSWLRSQSLSSRLTQNQRRLVEDVCMTLGVEVFRGRLLFRCERLEELSEVVHRIGQSVVRVSDIWFTLRTRAVATLADEVEEWLLEKQLTFDRSVKYSGRSGLSWTVDFQTFTPNRTSLIYLLSSGSRGAARCIAEHVTAGWTDLNHLKVTQPHTEFVSLFDDTSDVWHTEDFNLVEEVSNVAFWSNPEEFERVLVAA